MQQGDTYEGGRGTRLEVLELSPEQLVFERRYPPGTGKADPHFHLDMTQGWEVVSGTVSVVLDGERRPLAAGEKLEVPLRTPHRDPFNESGGEAVVRWHVEPVNEFVEAYASAYGHLLARGGLNAQDELPRPQVSVILHATRAQSYVTGLPVGLQRTLLPLFAALGRLRGYKPRYDPP